MPSNTKENGFETLIVNWLVNENGYEPVSYTHLTLPTILLV